MNALDGIRVIDITQNLAGPFCTQILGDLGADVIKIEPPGGDPARDWGPPFLDEQSTIFLSANRNKRSLTLDLRKEEACSIVRDLAASADIVVQSLRPGRADALDLGPDTLCGANPRLIYCSVTAYGVRGPLSGLTGYDPLMQAHGGVMSVTGNGVEPVRVGVSLVDMGTGLWTALAVLAALRDRDRTGRGTHIVASLFETALVWSSYHMIGYHADGKVPSAMGASFSLIAPYGAFPTSDGLLMIAGANDSLFRRLCTALDLGDLADDERFIDNPSRVANRVELEAVMARATGALSTNALQKALRDHGVPCAPILDMAGVMAEPQTHASGVIDRTPHPRMPDYASVGLPLEWGGQRTETRLLPPLPGEHTEQILAGLGYDAGKIARLVGEGVVGNNTAARDVQALED